MIFVSGFGIDCVILAFLGLAVQTQCSGRALQTDLRHFTETLRFTEDVKKNSKANPTTQRHLPSRTEAELIVSELQLMTTQLQC